MKKHIKNFSWVYAVIRWPITFAFILFYRKYIIRGKENVPRNTPLIFTPNHQCAAVDAFGLVTGVPFHQILFLSRADVFNKPVVSRILQFIKILPIYRDRDGAEALEKNKEIFDIAIETLALKKAVCTFPEARHNNSRFLLPLKKGIPRIAFTAEERNNFRLGVNIVPVGIYYDNYTDSGSIFQLIFGKPISVSGYIPLYKENPAKAFVALKNDMEAAIKFLMIDIQNREFNDMYENLRYIYNKNMKQKLGLIRDTQLNKFTADKKIIEILDKTFKENRAEFDILACKTSQYFQNLDTLKITDAIAEKSHGLFFILLKSLGLLLWLPVFIYSYLNNILPVLPIKSFVKKIKEPQFHSSVKFGMSLFLFPIFYTIQTVLVFLLSGNSWIGMGYILSLFPAIIIFVNCRRWYKNLFTEWNFLRTGKSILAPTLKLRSEIIQLMEEIAKAY
ncbi:MAG: 1-acyl-sn-glycerol-3-phosphate acyltransferase [Bacteroidia bacterium]|nr:1-acyl-sn-glycerol-3-phosphate acyltransferase [Bacteroidia bacterium]